MTKAEMLNRYIDVTVAKYQDPLSLATFLEQAHFIAGSAGFTVTRFEFKWDEGYWIDIHFTDNSQVTFLDTSCIGETA